MAAKERQRTNKQIDAETCLPTAGWAKGQFLERSGVKFDANRGIHVLRQDRK